MGEHPNQPYIDDMLLRIVDMDFERSKFLSRPSVMLGLKPFQDGNAFCVLLGENIQVGVCGFGDTPDEAMAAFDKEWIAKAKVAQHQQPQPAQPERKATLVEVCEEILELTKSARFSIAEWNLLADACDRHKKRQELVDELKRIIRVWQNRGCSESSVITAIDALDAFDKEAQ